MKTEAFMQSILQALARNYEESAFGRKAANRDYTIDYEKFLRCIDQADGDEREIAERELIQAELTSNGLLRIDRHIRTGHPERLRLFLDGGEQWLFQQIGKASPTEQRSELSNYFQEMAKYPVPDHWQQAWYDWFHRLSESAINGGNVQPFRRDDSAGNHTLVNTLVGILNWQGPTLIRYASTAICGDSKILQRLEPRLRIGLAAITGSDVLDEFGILRKPRFVTFHGSLILRIDDKETDFSMFPGSVTLAETNLTSESSITTNASVCLTVENEDTFHELVTTNQGVILILTSYAGAAVRRMIEMLPSNLSYYHFGDKDPAGVDILRDLREKSRRDILPLNIPSRFESKRRALVEFEIIMINRLLEKVLPVSLKHHLENLLEYGMPSNYEQESIQIPEVWAALAVLRLK